MTTTNAPKPAPKFTTKTNVSSPHAASPKPPRDKDPERDFLDALKKKPVKVTLVGEEPRDAILEWVSTYSMGFRFFAAEDREGKVHFVNKGQVKMMRAA